ncbi:hypothetical protein ASF49_01620 [Methylobacterium sp. Leaf104]|uniref:hypothetical protein n=1 Tax=Methylobacterium TaxID=407 RepID=UPI0007022207|nr:MULTISPECIES: hypothetical protein [Methylobacterium]KQP42572.1 hypothetical protein ASF49_01620 [Methylobacterium sp. Leaf104]MCI9878879.1 hypothetical protein [Methylobacterium goesingense]
MTHPNDDARSADDLVGELFRRLFLMREFHEPVFRAAIHDAIMALARAAHAEAEARGRRVAERTGSRPTDIAVTPWGRRRPTEGADLPEG